MHEEMISMESQIRDLDKVYFTEDEVNAFLSGGQPEMTTALRTLEARQAELNEQIQNEVGHRLEDDTDIQTLQDELVQTNKKIAALAQFITPENKAL